MNGPEEIKIHPHYPIHRNLNRIWGVRQDNPVFYSIITTTGNSKDNWNDY